MRPMSFFPTTDSFPSCTAISTYPIHLLHFLTLEVTLPFCVSFSPFNSKGSLQLSYRKQISQFWYQWVHSSHFSISCDQI
jgi:hypothetical protein